MVRLRLVNPRASRCRLSASLLYPEEDARYFRNVESSSFASGLSCKRERSSRLRSVREVASQLLYNSSIQEYAVPMRLYENFVTGEISPHDSSGFALDPLHREFYLPHL